MDMTARSEEGEDFNQTFVFCEHGVERDKQEEGNEPKITFTLATLYNRRTLPL
jgi:hypothetical protein